MMTKRKRGYAFLLALIVGAVVAFLALPTKQESITTAPVVSTKNETTAAAPAMPPPATPAPVARETMSAKVDRLTQSGSPADAFAAHELVFNCVILEGIYKQFDSWPAADREFVRKQWEPRAAELADCGTLAQWQRTDRHRNLAVAVKAGVPGAGLAYFKEGPLGDPGALESRANDPLVVAWKQEAVDYLRRDAIRGDVNAMGMMSDIYGGHLAGRITKPDPKEALVWEAAMWGVEELRRPASSVTARESLDRMSRGLSPADVAAAKAKGAELVAQCCSSSATSPTGKGLK